MAEGLERQDRRPLRDLLPAIAPALLAFAVFIPALGAGFVNWDDPAYVYQNPHIRSLDLGWAFTAVVASNYHPLTLLSHTLDYALFGLEPWGHHLTSLMLHGLNSALVYILSLALLEMIMPSGGPSHGRGGGGGPRHAGPSRGAGAKTGPSEWAVFAALAAAFLFAVHPLHVESVAWVAERKDVLSAFFFLLALITYLRYIEKALPLHYALSLVLFVLALLGKPMAVTLPVVLLILDYYPLKRDRRGWARLVMEKIPFFALSILSALLTLWAQSSGGAVTRMHSYPLGARLMVAVRGYVFYLYKLIYPAALAPYYPLPLNAGAGDPLFLGSLLLLIIISALCAYLALRGRRAPAALWVYYIVTLAPVIGIVQVGSQAAADRYAYITTIGFLMLAGFVLARLFTMHALRVPALLLTLIVVSLLGLKTVRTVPVWKDSVSLWTHEIEYLRSRGGEDRLAGVIAHYNLAKAYEAISRLSSAAEEYGRVLAINPRYLDAYVNRGVIYARLGKFDLAIEDFSRAIKIDPRTKAAYYNRALAYGETGEMERARRDMEMARRLGWGR